MASQDLRERLYRALPAIEEFKNTCKVASISVGVVHDNEVVFAESVGLRDVQQELPATPTTKYMTASISKTFTSAALGVLVHEGKLKWTDKVSDILKDFRPEGDPRIAREADFTDLLRHSSGLANPVVSWLGPQGMVVLNEEDFLDLVNQTPTSSERDGRFFNRHFIYSNLNYGIAAKAVEALSGQPYATFVKEKLLKPLGMDSTSLSQEDDNADENVAYPHFQRSDGSFTSLKLHWTSEKLTSVLGSVGVQSSVNDLLTWCIAVMHDEVSSEGEGLPPSLNHLRYNPLKEMSVIRKGYWTRPDLDDDDDDPNCNATYCLGWFRDTMPSTQVGWGSGNSDPTTDFVIGKDSEERVVIKHTGLGVGLTASVLTFPKTRSAVVALCNGYNGCDAADFAAQHLTQELFDLNPRVNLNLRATQEHERRRLVFHNKIMLDWLENRNVQTPEQELTQYTGDYTGLAITLSIVANSQDGKLSLIFNHRYTESLPLEYYNVDTYSFMPTTRDQWLSGGWLDWDYYRVGILQFWRGESNAVEGLLWQWEEQTKPTRFSKTSLTHRQDALCSKAESKNSVELNSKCIIG